MRLFSTEQVTKYHPDKVCDQISDAVLDACLAQDPDSHVACETLMKGRTVVLAGEITTKAKVDYAAIATRVCGKLGYKVDDVITLIGTQSPEIAAGVNEGRELQGAGDQGMMFGYATCETESMLPFGFDLANRITKKLEEAAVTPYSILTGDAKTQVTVDLDAKPGVTSVKKILVSACHKPQTNLDLVRQHISTLVETAIEEAAKAAGYYPPSHKEAVQNIDLIINPNGAWTLGGPEADCGLTGRKIVCDQYGGYCPVGGGAFSGKDPSKVDRSGAYMARKIACDLLKKHGLFSCEVQIAYAIGQARPMSVSVKSNRPHRDADYEQEVSETYDLTPAGIIKALDLKRPIYEKLAEGCHFREV